MNRAEPDTDTEMQAILARSKRQMLDWSLVLASQEIPTTITEVDTHTWALVVPPEEYPRAREAIRLYRLENQGWSWRQPIPWTEAAFDWGALGWCFLLILVHWLGMDALAGFRSSGDFDSVAVAHGEWWRAFTAVLLHWDLAHLLGNVTIGFVIWGLAMARYGAGLALFSSYLAGAFGNLAGFLLYSKAYHGMGASGMVMGALGLLALPPLLPGPNRLSGRAALLGPAAACVMLFLLFGVDPKSDLLAHLGGFVAGTIFGFGLNLVPARIRRHPAVTAAVWVLFVVLVVGTAARAVGGG